jgi:endonuclease/exonuclease/phosphatase family metal-dependent hydrolase
MRVLQYNLLSSSLAAPGYFNKCNPANLDSATRLSRILAKLDLECSASSPSRPIICLQEVSRKWEGPLHVFFEKHNYQFVTGLYGRVFNGYMGVALAYPLDAYKTEALHIDNLADEGEWPKAPEEAAPPAPSPAVKAYQFLAKLATNPLRFLLPSPGKPEVWKNDDVYEAASKRSNILITATLTPLASPLKPFTISCYHMPCAFRTPQLMTLHSTLAVRHTAKLAEGKPFICAGDWNITPDSGLYRMLATGECEAALLPPVKHGVAFKPDIGTGVHSAYALANGREPDFTNYAQTKNDDEPFIDTLDYIFLSKCGRWRVDKVDAVVHRDDMPGPLPNDTEPSDHVSIGADLTLL